MTSTLEDEPPTVGRPRRIDVEEWRVLSDGGVDDRRDRKDAEKLRGVHRELSRTVRRQCGACHRCGWRRVQGFRQKGMKGTETFVAEIPYRGLPRFKLHPQRSNDASFPRYRTQRRHHRLYCLPGPVRDG